MSDARKDGNLFIVEDESGLLELLGNAAGHPDQPYAWSKWKRIWPLGHLDEMVTSKPEPPPQLEYEHCERLGTRLLARAIELAPTLGIDPQEVGKPKDETAQLRALVAALMPVYEAAFVWSGESSTPTDCLGERTVQPSCNHNQYAGAIIHAPECNEYKANIALRDAIEQDRDRVTAALAGVAVDEEKERMRRLCEAACRTLDERTDADGKDYVRPSRLHEMWNAVDAYRRGAR